MSKNLKIPCPTKLEVNKYLAIWNGAENLHKTEEALKKLFDGCNTNNKDTDDVLIKVYALNNAFGVFMLSQVRMAKHITNQNIDENLRAGDLAVVDKIRKGHSIRNRYGTEINFYSFATKYCSFHQPKKYPLFDSNVKTALIYFKKNCEKFAFGDEDLTKYNKFVGIIREFQKVFDIQDYSFRDIDKYLYLVGKKIKEKRDEAKKKS